MRIERIEASKHKRGRVLLILADGTCLKITEQELLDFGLRSGDELGEETLSQLKKAAGISDVKAAAADLIGKRAMSRAALEKKLREKGASEAEARYAAEWLEAIGAIDDGDYAVLLAQHCARQGLRAPAGCRKSCGKRAFPGSCGRMPWPLCRTRRRPSTPFCGGSSGNRRWMKERKSVFATPCCAGAFPGEM